MTQVSASQPLNFWKNPRSWLYSFWKFSRPHTIFGTSLSVFALYGIAFARAQPSEVAVVPLLVAWLACLCGNIYIVGLNQLEDVAIDRINKPHLPIAAGEFSIGVGRWIVGITGTAALLLAAFSGRWLMAVVGASLALGTAYSLPPVRLKRFPFWAAFCILAVRGAIINIGLYLHFSTIFQQKEVISPAVWALTFFVLIFSIAIAIFKDVPDTEGDKEYNIATLTLLLGKPAILQLARGLISLGYLGLIVAAILGLPGVNASFLAISHLFLLGLLWWRSRRVDLEDKSAIAKFYQFIWKLFFLEYLLFPLACFLS
ncbi:homogentisate phytyltransferase [Oscillatoria sp. FACHB-1406]|uniref:homogentisate phytyltransferase n=1 Tax=Oscillatoria sp. FACHB-1406 TaxID=2692846 RepID=UPI0016879B20|nr:homogentisate phytyltransferase [Oscillatoria sp. FACHB-1406]MBD2577907.1 homogentisate phytyltransferase [Oscillatoria sp. FACHB-1406]